MGNLLRAQVHFLGCFLFNFCTYVRIALWSGHANRIYRSWSRPLHIPDFLFFAVALHLLLLLSPKLTILGLNLLDFSVIWAHVSVTYLWDYPAMALALFQVFGELLGFTKSCPEGCLGTDFCVETRVFQAPANCNQGIWSL